MELVKQIGFAVLVLSLCGLFGCGKDEPTAFEKLLKARTTPSVSMPGSNQELLQARQMWRDTYRDKHLKILAEMDRLLIPGAIPNPDSNFWQESFDDATGGLYSTFDNSKNSTIQIFIGDLHANHIYMVRFLRYTKEKAPIGAANDAAIGYKKTIEKIDKDLDI